MILKSILLSKAGIFGSYASNSYNENSDVDVLIELSKNISILDFVGIQFELEEILKKKVDLVEYSCIKPIIRGDILKQEVRIL